MGPARATSPSFDAGAHAGHHDEARAPGASSGGVLLLPVLPHPDSNDAKETRRIAQATISPAARIGLRSLLPVAESPTVVLPGGLGFVPYPVIGGPTGLSRRPERRLGRAGRWPFSST